MYVVFPQIKHQRPFIFTLTRCSCLFSEEILGRRPSLAVSPNDKYLCFASFNDTDVPLFKIALYGKPPTAYTRIQDIAYPKPGTTNPDVHIYIYDVKNKKTVELLPPMDFRNR